MDGSLFLGENTYTMEYQSNPLKFIVENFYRNEMI